MPEASEDYEFAISLEALANEIGWKMESRSFRGKVVAMYFSKKPLPEPGGEHEDPS